MPTYTVEVTGLVGRDWTPPVVGVPLNLRATPGSTQVALTWDPPAGATGITDYVVQYKAAASSTYSTFAHTPGTATSRTVTGLTNGTAYDLRVAAVVAAGTGQYTADVHATPTNASVTTTIFGYNTDDDAPLSERLGKWDNRAPCVRRYNSDFVGTSFPITTAIAPEKCVSYSFKDGGGPDFTLAGLAQGRGNARLTAWCESIPPNWTVFLTYYHEVNDDIRLAPDKHNGITPAQMISYYRDAYTQFRIAIDAANLQSGVTVKLVSNFMAYRVADTPNYFDDSWVPPEADIMTFDVYGNPGHFTTQVLAPNCGWSGQPNPVVGSEYGASFPPYRTRLADLLKAIIRNGYKDSWGILEHNTPPREFDGPANPGYVCGSNKRLRYQGGRTAAGHNATHTEVERAQWLKDCVDYCQSEPVFTINGVDYTLGKPKIWLFWEHPLGVNWNQQFYHDNVWNALKPYIVGTPTLGGSPV